MLDQINYIVKPDELDRMELFNNRKTRWTMEQVQEHLGCDVVFPGPYFDSHAFQPVVYCKIDGEFLCNPGYNNYGVILDHGRPYLGKVPNTAADYWANDVLIIDGQKRTEKNMHLHPDAYQRRGRAVVMGFSDGSVMFRATRDGGPCADTVLGEQENAHKRGAVWAVGDDGGRSGNIITPDGSILINDYGQNHTRIMPVYIIAYLKKEGGDKMKYSMKSQRGVKVADNFHVREFACHDGSDTVLIDPKLPELLQRIRDHFGPVNINSGYRTPNYNRKVGGATHSQHVLGKAADIHINGVTPADIAEYADKLGAGGVGLYDSFVHVDVRARHVRWKNNKETNHHETVVSGFAAEDVTVKKESVHAEAIAWAETNGITDGSNLQSSPTKAEIISMLFRNEKRKGTE